MKHLTIRTWSDFEKWAGQYDTQKKECAFRGQADAKWPLRTSLARCFLKHKTGPHEWRKRELKMYRMFRERLLAFFPGMYDDWKPLDVLALMQHYQVPTRLLDFTYCPYTAAFFALEKTRSDSVIFLSNKKQLHTQCDGSATYFGPTHDDHYHIAEKTQERVLIVEPDQYSERLAAQKGCFLLPEHISETNLADKVEEQVILSETMVLDALRHLKAAGKDKKTLFATAKTVSKQCVRFAFTGRAEPETIE